ncbi:MAG: hypothetical protein ACI3W5_04920 [Faecousia sp.]
MESNTRKIQLEPERNPKYIVFSRKIGGVLEPVKECLTYHPELEKILMLDCLKPYRNNGYLKFIINVDGSETRFTIYDLALGCYMGRIHYQTYLSDIQDFMDEKTYYSLVIDHADNIIHNHTIYNLSLMTAQENKQKSDIVCKFKLPARVSVAYVDEKYRVFIGNSMNDTSRLESMVNCLTKGLLGVGIRFEAECDARQYFICEDAESLIQCLRYISEHIVVGCEPIKNKKGGWKKGGECLFMDISKSIAEQERISALDEGCFDVFEVSKDDSETGD